MKKEYSFVLLLVLACAGFAVLGYEGLISVGNDQQMPIIYRLEDPTYLENDFFVRESMGFNVRVYFSHLLLVANRLFHDYDLTQMALLFLTTAAIATNIYFLARFFWKDKTTCFFIALCMILVTQFNLGGMLLVSWLKPNSLSDMMVLTALNLILRRKDVLGYLVLGVGALFQPIAPLLMYATFLGSDCPVALSRGRIRRCVLSVARSLPFLLVASLVLVPLLASNIGFEMTDAERSTLFQLTVWRYSTHMAPSTWHPIRFLLYVPFVTMAAALFRRHVQSYRSHALAYGLITTGVLAASVLFVEVFPVVLVAQAILLRVLVFFSAFAYIFILYHVFRLIRNPASTFDRLAGLAIPVLFFEYVLVPFGLLLLFLTLVGLPGVFDRVRTSAAFRKMKFALLAGGIPLALVGLALFARLALRLIASYDLIAKFPFLLFIVGKAIPYMLGCALILVPALQGRWKLAALVSVLYLALVAGTMQTRDISETGLCGDLYGATAHIRQSTPKESVFLVSPLWYTFRLCADRAIVVDITPVFSRKGMLLWYDRLKDIYRLDALEKTMHDNWDWYERRFNQLNETDILGLREKYGIGYVVRDPALEERALDFLLEYRDERAVVYRIVSP